MSNKYEATFHPGEPLPRRDPMASLGSFDRTARPAPVDSDEAYLSPGTPPWVEAPLWPLYLVATLSVVTVIGLITALAIAI